MIRETEGMEKLMKNSGLLVRVISGIVLLLILLIVGICGGGVLLFFTTVSALVGLYEFYKATGVYNPGAEDKKTNILAFLGFLGCGIYYLLVAVGGILPLSINFENMFSKDVNFFGLLNSYENLRQMMTLSYIYTMLAFIIIMLVVLMAAYVFTFPRFTINEVAYAFVGIIYVPVFMSFMYLTRLLQNGKFVFWLIFISSWICDTAAYFVGSSIGKHKLAPILSPKKSIEGAVGGVLGACIIAFVFGYFIEYKIFGGANNSINYMIICSVGAVISQIGDLAASGIKRNKDIKDYGTLIPGHGGVLDRFDSVIFTAPFTFMLAWAVM